VRVEVRQTDPRRARAVDLRPQLALHIRRLRLLRDAGVSSGR
jgi:hypothetical protein